MRDFGKIGSVAGITAVLPIAGSTLLLTFVYQIGPWLQEHQWFGVFMFVSFMTVFCGLALLATNILGIVSGFAFDFQMGILAQLTGIIGASTLMFLISKRYASKKFLSIIDRKPKFKAIHNALLNENFFKTILIITLIRLSPAVPFSLTNFLVSASGISFKTFILGTFLGMVPRASALVFVGSSLSELDFSQPQESWLLVLGIIATILAVCIIGILSKKALSNMVIEKNI